MPWAFRIDGNQYNYQEDELNGLANPRFALGLAITTLLSTASFASENVAPASSVSASQDVYKSEKQLAFEKRCNRVLPPPNTVDPQQHHDAIIKSLEEARGKTDKSTETVGKNYVRMYFVEHDVYPATDRYVSENLMKHDPHIEDGKYSNLKYFESRTEDMYATNPDEWVSILDHFFVNGNYFSVHHHGFLSCEDPGRIFWDLYRVEDGLIVEHWNIIQPLVEETASGRPMW